jgi:hypothetical protein
MPGDVSEANPEKLRPPGRVFILCGLRMQLAQVIFIARIRPQRHSGIDGREMFFCIVRTPPENAQ